MKALSPRQAKTIIIGAGALTLALMALWWGSRKDNDNSLFPTPSTESHDREKKFLKTSTVSNSERVAATSDKWQSSLDDLFDTQRFPVLDQERFMTLFRDWFETDKEAATQAALQLKDESLRRLALEQGIVLFSQDVGILVEFCSNSFSDPMEKYRFAISCVEELSPLHLDSALSMLSRKKFAEYRSDGIGAIFERLGKSGNFPFMSVISHATEFEGKDRDRALRAALRYCNDITLEDCKVLLNHTNDTRVLVTAFKSTSEKMVSEMSIEDLGEKLSDLALTRPVSRKVFEICLIQGAKSKPLEDVLNIMQQSPLWEKGVDEQLVASLIASEFSISSAQNYALGLPDNNKNKGDAIAGVASSAIREDVAKASEWIGSLPEGKMRDKALKPLLNFLKKKNDVESLEQWSGLLSVER